MGSLANSPMSQLTIDAIIRDEMTWFTSQAIKHDFDIFMPGIPDIGGPPYQRSKESYRIFCLHFHEPMAMHSNRVLRIMLARAQGEEEEYVVKLCEIKNGKWIGIEEIEVFSKELECLSRLRGHPNIISIRGIYREITNGPDGVVRYGIVMNRIREDVYESVVKLREKALKYAAQDDGLKCRYLEPHTSAFKSFVVQVLYQCATAMSYIHKRGYVHNDIKMENILLDENYNIRICDFGFASDLRGADVKKGTEGFVPFTAYMKSVERSPQERIQDEVYIFGRFIVQLVCAVFVAEDRMEEVFNQTCRSQQYKFPYSLETLAKEWEEDTGVITYLLGIAEECCSLARNERPSICTLPERLIRIRTVCHLRNFDKEIEKVFSDAPSSGAAQTHSKLGLLSIRNLRISLMNTFTAIRSFNCSKRHQKLNPQVTSTVSWPGGK